jgi:hypothetical protein
MTDRIHLSRRQFLKTSFVASGCSLLRFGHSWADAASKENCPNILWLTSENKRAEVENRF